MIEHVCSRGHYIAQPNTHKVRIPKKCPAYTHGKPCDGELKRIGEGSRKATQDAQ